MNKVITINLNGRAYQVEEEGYKKLQEYLEDAATRLANDPDKTEIVADLEQAIAEKMDRFLSVSKTVVTQSETAEVLKEMGPVEGAAADGSTKEQTPKTSTVKRLYKIREGAMIGGVCTGLAAYFNIDVTLVRLAFVALGLITHGAWIAVYIIMLVVLPEAATEGQKAAAFGKPFTAQEMIDKARAEYTKFADKGEWKKWKYEWKQNKKKWKNEWKDYHHDSGRPYISPLSHLITTVLALAWIYGLFMLITTGAVFGILATAFVPLWVAILIWVLLYNFVMWPFKAGRYFRYYNEDGTANHYHYHHGSFMETIGSIAFFTVLVWVLYQYAPATHPIFDRVVEVFNSVVGRFRR